MPTLLVICASKLDTLYSIDVLYDDKIEIISSSLSETQLERLDRAENTSVMFEICIII